MRLAVFEAVIREITAAEPRNQVAYCPYCDDRLLGLLDACAKPDCSKREMDDLSRSEGWCEL